MGIDSIRFWRIRSGWDYLAFIPVFQWTALATAVLILSGAAAGLEPLTPVGLGLLAVGLGANALGWLAALAVYRGSPAHAHLDPSGFYILGALFFGPLIGPHYLYRTGRA